MFAQDELTFLYICVNNFNSGDPRHERNKHVMALKLLEMLDNEPADEVPAEQDERVDSDSSSAADSGA